MHVASKVFWLAKAGSAPEEYEDAYWPGKPSAAKAKLARFAVADGATEASFSGLWARDLVRAYGRGWFAGRDRHRPIEALRAAWQKHFDGKPLPWYAEEKLRMGAFSSLMGLTIAGSTFSIGARGAWAAISIGDSCEWHCRQQTLCWRGVTFFRVPPVVARGAVA